MRGLWTILVVLGIALTGCDQDKIVYEKLSEFPDASWSYGEGLDFDFTLSDTTAQYRILLYLEFETDYRWQNLYTRAVTTMPDGTVVEDKVSLELASRAGEWYGDCNAKVCELNIPLQDRVRTRTAGDYHIRFEQFMRSETVDGIRAIGLKVVELAPE
jgi:gliding motility-associated lipoprotein GldH